MFTAETLFVDGGSWQQQLGASGGCARIGRVYGHPAHAGRACEAVRIDPGRISIDARTFCTPATDPIQIGIVGVDDRYLRRFYITWTVEPGTFRIVGDRLSYEPICTLTVPVE